MSHKFIQRVSIDWNQIGSDSYLHSIEALKSMEVLDFQKNVAFFVGENGTGKSTLIDELLMIGERFFEGFYKIRFIVFFEGMRSHLIAVKNTILIIL